MTLLQSFKGVIKCFLNTEELFFFNLTFLVLLFCTLLLVYVFWSKLCESVLRRALGMF